MRLNTFIVIATVTLVLGLILGESHLWIPISVLVAGFVDLKTRSGVASDRLGEWANLSTLLKFLFSLIGFYATVGQLACIGLAIWWLVS